MQGVAGTLGGIGASAGNGDPLDIYRFGFQQWSTIPGSLQTGSAPVSRQQPKAVTPSEPGKPIAEAAARPTRKIRIVEE
jgi:hypothetical protein